ncbi:hypothetical protein GCM10010430_48810 [Kitasatospora cystarginea]|uniref:Apea-like HEPN domain-containing protein n=1 Tax=Kitasatospora cystarginea TaxID=58350 RepID=A0ABN3EHH4_9ACTN
MAYSLAVDEDNLGSLLTGDAALTDPQISLANELVELRKHIAENFAELPTNQVLGFIVSQLGGDGRTVARSWRMRTVGAEVDSPTTDPVDGPLMELALEAYPALLLPRDEELYPGMRWMLPINAVRVLLAHPKAQEFREAVLADSLLGSVFAEESEQPEARRQLFRSTGQGGSPQLSMLASTLISYAWRRLQGGPVNPGRFAAEVLLALQLARAAFTKKPEKTTARVAFAGVLLPPQTQFKVGPALMRAVTDKDREYAPESLRAQLTGTNPSGETTIINYDGDVLLEYRLNYRAKVVRSEELPGDWPSDMLPPPELAQMVTRLRFSLMLAVDRDSRAQLVQTWNYIEDPLSAGPNISWNDPRQGTGIMPMLLTQDEVAAWEKWYGRLTDPAAKLDLALSRILRAIAERREPSDVLIDSVIAWENVFGTQQGEPTFRVTMCIAKLLEENTEARAGLRDTLAKIYGLRSKVVHGNRNLKQEEYPLCFEAMEIAIRMIRTLAADRTDILALPDGARRSEKLLLDG